MIWIFIIAVVLVLIINSGSKKTNIDKYIPHSKTDDTIITTKENEDNGTSRFESWKIEYEKSIKEEFLRIENGFYDAEYWHEEFEVKGTYFRTKLAKETIRLLDLISDVHFILEPTNEYDPFAVKVVYDRKRLGYIPRYLSERFFNLVKEKRIHKIFVIDNGYDLFSKFDDELFITLRVYYSPSEFELEQKRKEQERLQKEKEEKEKLRIQRMNEVVPFPPWVNELEVKVKNVTVEDDLKKWKLKQLKDNVRNSIKSYEKAFVNGKEIIMNNALKRLEGYKNDLNELIN